MRIVAGRLRRRKLESPRGLNTRPITDRAKETLFENLGGELHGERVADVFSGTGTIGLEALSRGASRVVCFEKDTTTFELLRQNVKSLGVDDEVVCWKTDVTRTSFRPRNADGFFPYDLVFFDPPYRMVADVHPRTMLFRSFERLARPEVTSPGVLLLFRTPKKAVFELPPVWTPAWDLVVSNMVFYAFHKDPAQTPPADDSSSEGETA